jgi:hypothetical protein
MALAWAFSRGAGEGVFHQDIGDMSLESSATHLLGDRRHR